MVLNERGSVSGPIRHILFVCTGNICRSPFAAGILNKFLQDKGLLEIRADSAGLLALPGNAATAMAQRVAAEYDVDLSSHRAKPVSARLLTWCDLALVMEKSHEKELLDAFPEALNQVLLLRHFARYGSRRRGISDPYGLQYEAYRFCFLDIQEAVSGLVQYLGGRSKSFEPIKASCYEGYKSCESPRSFEWQGRRYAIRKIVDRWYEGQQDATGDIVDYYRVETDEGSMLILRYERHHGRWWIMAR